jgi:hypothetical protein
VSRKELTGDLDPIPIWAGMILQEGKDAALEIAEACGVEAALDAMNHIGYERYLETLRLKERLAIDDEMIDRAAAAAWRFRLDPDERDDASMVWETPDVQACYGASFREEATAMLRAALEVTDDQ